MILEMEWISSRGMSNRSVERLKNLYVELLLSVDITSDDLGIRRNEELKDCPVSPKRTLLRRSLSRSRKISGSEGSSKGESSNSKSLQETAFRFLSASAALDKDNGDNGGAVAVRDGATVSALFRARSVESKVIQLVRKIGEVVADSNVSDSGASIRSDAVFEYFCDKNMLSILVDIAKAKPSDGVEKQIKLHKVAFSPRVKAQIYQTIAILISNAQDAPSLYYLLSNNYVNEMITGMFPLRQWNNHALEEMLPLYVELLRSIGIQLAASPGLLSCLSRDESQSHNFPLFYAAVEVLTSSYANADSYLHDKCLKIVISLMQIPDASVRALTSTATAEHQKLSLHVCQRLLDRYRRLCMLTTGPVVDPIRSNAIAGQLGTLQHEIESLNDILWCGVKKLNVRTCECLLQRLVSKLLRDFFSSERRHLLAGVGDFDTDAIPEREAIAQVATLFLSHLFLRLAYPPFIRMLAVALLHPLSSAVWKKPLPRTETSIDSYVLTKSLNRIISASSDETGEVANKEDIIPNHFRKELLVCLSGECGEWRFAPVAILLEAFLTSEALDLDTLLSLKVLPSFSKKESRYPESPFEDALAQFLRCRAGEISAVSISAMERAGSLSMTMIPHIASSMTNRGKDISLLSKFIHASPLVQSLGECQSFYCTTALQFQDTTGVSQLFLDLVELTIKSRYLKLGENHCRQGMIDYGCPLEMFSCSQQSRNAEILVRKIRTVGSNDVEDARFAIRMAIHFRALRLAVKRMIEDCSSASTQSGPSFSLDTIDRADDLLLLLGDLKEKPMVSTDLDLRGRMIFRFFPATSKQQKSFADDDCTGRRKIPEEIILRSRNQLILVLDPTDVFIVKHIDRSDVNRGTIICRVSLRSVIACASDGDWLHVAVRNVDDVDLIIKNGNMALHFDSPGTSLIVRQYLERSRKILRSDLSEKIQLLFSNEGAEERNGQHNEDGEKTTEPLQAKNACRPTESTDESTHHITHDEKIVRV